MGAHIWVDDQGNIWERVGVVEWASNTPEVRKEVQRLRDDWASHHAVMPTRASIVKQDVSP